IGDEYALYCSLSAPYPAAYRMLGFSGLMVALKEAPDMVTAIAERQLTNSLAAATAAREAGLGIVFVEEWACSADLISPQDYLTFAWPFERDLCAGLERLGFSTVFYFCGPLQDRLEHLCCLAAEALAFEESKKGWTIDLQQVRSQVGEQRCLFGNLDVRKVRDLSPMALQAEVHDMIEKVGPSAFITSIGSPLTLDTPPTKVNALIQAARCYSGPMG
ncbi:MAG: uroporphyrinogen decarboxylase family protein, partial [Candidatus Zipacnadales bacterium]